MNNFHFHTKVKLKRLKKLDKRNVDNHNAIKIVIQRITEGRDRLKEKRKTIMKVGGFLVVSLLSLETRGIKIIMEEQGVGSDVIIFVTTYLFLSLFPLTEWN